MNGTLLEPRPRFGVGEVKIAFNSVVVSKWILYRIDFAFGHLIIRSAKCNWTHASVLLNCRTWDLFKPNVALLIDD